MADDDGGVGLRRADRIIKKIVAWAVAALYHRVEVRQAPKLTADGPVLANASHFGGFTDPLLLIHVMDRVPRFVARDVIWKTPVARNIMNWVGAIPVHKSDDGGPASNEQMFRSTFDALRSGELITIFPEGITVDDPSIANIKTGSARIALGARADGVEGIRLVSAGIHYENKAALRSEVFVDIGWEIDLDTWVEENTAPGEDQDASNRRLVHSLTEEMERRLRLAAPDFEDWATARALAHAADIAMRSEHDTDGVEVGYGDGQRLARLLDEADDQRRGRVVEAVTRYESDIDAIGLSDEMIMSGMTRLRSFTWYLIRSLIIGLILLPFALAGVIVNAIPMAIVWLIGRLRVADAMMATLKPIGALLAFLITWTVWAYLAWRGWGFDGVVTLLLLLPIFLFALIAIVERGVLVLKAIAGFGRSLSFRKVRDQIREHRREVVEAVADAA